MIGIHRLMKPWYVWRPWQLARRVRVAWMARPDSDRALRVAWGVSLRADPRMTIGRSLQTTGLHDPAVTEVLARLIRAGDTVVDAGAQIRVHDDPLSACVGSIRARRGMGTTSRTVRRARAERRGSRPWPPNGPNHAQECGALQYARQRRARHSRC